LAKGKTTKEANVLVLSVLKERNVLYREGIITTAIHAGWRCDERIGLQTGKEWFISSEEIRPLMIKEIENVTGYPDWAKKSMLGLV